MGVLLSAGLSISWFAEKILGKSATSEEIAGLLREAEEVAPGADGVEFIPSLNGTRTPVVDPTARGSLTGLSVAHGRGHVIRAMVEGVCMTFNESLQLMSNSASPIVDLVASGGGARAALWRQTLSDVSGLPVRATADDEHSALGAAVAAARGIGVDLEPLISRHLTSTCVPDPRRHALYVELAEARIQRIRQEN